jgi:hypothetical protein
MLRPVIYSNEISRRQSLIQFNTQSRGCRRPISRLVFFSLSALYPCCILSAKSRTVEFSSTMQRVTIGCRTYVYQQKLGLELRSILKPKRWSPREPSNLGALLIALKSYGLPISVELSDERGDAKKGLSLRQVVAVGFWNKLTYARCELSRSWVVSI